MTVRKVRTSPRANEMLIDHWVIVKRQMKLSPPAPPKALAISMTRNLLARIPAAVPTAAAPIAYASPSKVNICTRWPRFSPTALEMPISCILSDASSTKIRKTSSSPTMTVNDPKNVKKVTNRFPTASATDRPSTLISVTWSCEICWIPKVSCGTSWRSAGSLAPAKIASIKPRVSVDVISPTNRSDGCLVLRLSWISRRSSAWLALNAPPCTDSVTM